MLAALSEATTATLGPRLVVTAGGASRRDSVRLGLEACAAAVSGPKPARPEESEQALGRVPADLVVLVHDGARPWLSPGLAAKAAAEAASHGAAIPLLPLADTPKAIGPGGLIVDHPPRSGFGAAQTPQAFAFAPLLAAHRRALAEGVDCTDDAELWARYVGPVHWFEGEPGNRKITWASDLPGASGAASAAAEETSAAAASDSGAAAKTNEAAAGPGPASPDKSAASAAALRESESGHPPFSIGEGWDLHRLAPGRALMLGGLDVASDLGEVAHSDGDVLLHAVIDALLGAAALGDIGTHFPPSESRWKDADSRELARAVAALVRGAGWEPSNLDCTVVLERPKLGPHKDAMRDSIAAVLGMPRSRVSVKAKTSEGVDAAGERRAVEARAVVLLHRAPRD
jgi:2-C-methyl-D-erythritol 4-phosphate cytidylyltransferase/2-C-methyl-D-erythritol 2,4-cyclodiphosphate synthase